VKKVFVPNEGAGHDYSDAERYGELVFVTGGSINPFDTGVMNRAWSSALADSSPSDYLVVTSLNSLCMIGAAQFAIKHKRLNLLLFSSRGKYRKREIVF
jgi:hypothetical protein